MSSPTLGELVTKDYLKRQLNLIRMDLALMKWMLGFYSQAY